MVSTPSPPPAPDPKAVSAASTASNVNTAVAQTGLNAVNQVTPSGNLTYTKAPGSTIPDGNGGFVDVPQYTATTTLSPEEQNIFNLGQQTRSNVGQIGVDQSARIGQLLGTPVDLSPNAVDAHLTDLGMQRLQPQLDKDWQNRETALMNRGVMPGSENFTNEQDAFNRQRNDAYNQLILNGYGQGQQSILAARNQPINEITALMSGSQVSQPNFVNTPQSQVAPTNVAGIYDSANNYNMGVYNQQMQNANGLNAGLFGLAAAPLGGIGFGLGKKYG